MSIISSLVTDRTAADVSRWLDLRNKGFRRMTEAERAEWSAGMKGAYNATDLNRVGEALHYLRDVLSSFGYLSVSDFVAKTDWTAADIPTADNLTNYLRYVSIVREALAQFGSTPATPENTGGLDYQDANAIEQILVDVERLIVNMQAAWFHMGDLYCGEV